MIRRAPLLIALLASPALAQEAAPPEVAPERVPDRGVMQRQDSFRDAAMAPLEDLNLKQSAIPDVLRRAVESPYDMDGMTRCEEIAGEIGRLDAALGPDLDEAPPPDQRTRMQKAGAAVKSAGVSAVRDETTGALPFRGWIRRLTGAARHDKAVQEAIRAGGVRRGYLKGMGMQKNCAPPAAPSWFVPVTVREGSGESPRGETGFLGLVIRFLTWLRSLLPF